MRSAYCTQRNRCGLTRVEHAYLLEGVREGRERSLGRNSVVFGYDSGRGYELFKVEVNSVVSHLVPYVEVAAAVGIRVVLITRRTATATIRQGKVTVVAPAVVERTTTGRPVLSLSRYLGDLA